MLTLDTLQRMADRMPSERSGESGKPPYRRPDAKVRVREVTLPSVREEARRAVGLFAFVVVVALAVFVPVGVLATHASELAFGGATPRAVTQTALWFGGWTLAMVVPLAGIGLFREVRRYRRVRATIGEHALIDASRVLRSADGQRSWPL